MSFVYFLYSIIEFAPTNCHHSVTVMRILTMSPMWNTLTIKTMMMKSKTMRPMNHPQTCSMAQAMEAMNVKTVLIRMQRYHHHRQKPQTPHSPNSIIQIHHLKHPHHRRMKGLLLFFVSSSDKIHCEELFDTNIFSLTKFDLQ